MPATLVHARALRQPNQLHQRFRKPNIIEDFGQPFGQQMPRADWRIYCGFRVWEIKIASRFSDCANGPPNPPLVRWRDLFLQANTYRAVAFQDQELDVGKVVTAICAHSRHGFITRDAFTLHMAVAEASVLRQ